ncbi:MAG: OmpA family protein [Candidatus Thiodiazotropha endolucinida]|uniref:Outer membrane protein P6 n=1 Tax=Candidatus Thiodiazotropha endolucinida TaxID=1655433 RepID=A0A7Z0VKI0_9GAMM|nr:OmpA family protein [Candidatus Thiodiazotropha endolucinida]ODJ86839.1 outer membrane protein P6 precursor [Candidatus Thiodiazotropha endolucinida]
MMFSDYRQYTSLSIIPMRFLVLLVLVIPPCLNAADLEDQLYMAGMHESVWEFSGSDYSCELKHEVPQFGVARFRRIAGENLHFFITSFQPVPESVDGFVRELSPAWEHTPPDTLQLSVAIQTGMRPMALKRKQAGWLLTSLTKGQIGSFSFPDWDDNRRQVRVPLSPVKFQKPYREFKRCLRQLPNSGGFTELKNSTVHFALDVDAIDNRGEQQLARLAAYVLADEKINRIIIEGHADDQGSTRYNKRLSARRAANVYNYLSGKGVKEGMMIQQHYGESRPKIAKRTARARAANRRVEINLRQSPPD